MDHFLSAAADVSPDHPVVITKFIDNAQEIDVDAVAHKGQLIVHAVSEHVENAGVHSGDATLVLPPFSLSEEDLDRLKVIAEKVGKAWEISGPYNMQVRSATEPTALFVLVAQRPSVTDHSKAACRRQARRVEGHRVQLASFPIVPVSRRRIPISTNCVITPGGLFYSFVSKVLGHNFIGMFDSRCCVSPVFGTHQ